MNASVIVTTYNRPDALSAVLRALSRQTAQDFEIIVADDGSTAETGQLLREWKPKLRLDHVWQEDRGFRAARARNLAVARSSGEYLIFLDGDCIPFPDFVEAHLRLAGRGRFISGNRVMLSPAFTRRVLHDQLPIESWSLRDFAAARVRGDIPRLLPLLRFKGNGFKHFSPRRWFGAKSCNLGIWRSDFMRIDGFDEAFEGWGHEDADLVSRLIRSGILRKSGRFAVPVLHLWHEQEDRAALQDNVRRLENTLATTRVRALQGVSGHLKSAG